MFQNSTGKVPKNVPILVLDPPPKKSSSSKSAPWKSSFVQFLKRKKQSPRCSNNNNNDCASSPMLPPGHNGCSPGSPMAKLDGSTKVALSLPGVNHTGDVGGDGTPMTGNGKTRCYVPVADSRLSGGSWHYFDCVHVPSWVYSIVIVFTDVCVPIYSHTCARTFIDTQTCKLTLIH